MTVAKKQDLKCSSVLRFLSLPPPLSFDQTIFEGPTMAILSLFSASFVVPVLSFTLAVFFFVI